MQKHIRALARERTALIKAELNRCATRAGFSLYTTEHKRNLVSPTIFFESTADLSACRVFFLYIFCLFVVVFNVWTVGDVTARR